MEGLEKALHIRVQGRVQRLGYRCFVLEAAQELGIKGKVKNEPDGSITVFAQGEKGRLTEFLARIKAPPPPIAIRGFEERPAQPDSGIEHFQIAYGPLAEEPQEGFGAMQNEFKNYRDEFRGFAERTDQSINVLDQKYGEISARLSQALEAFQRESLETRKELTRAVDTLSGLVRQFIEGEKAKAQPAEEAAEED